MRIVVTGATGNVGTSVVDALVADPRVTEIVGIARRRPKLARPRTTWCRPTSRSHRWRICSAAPTR